MSDHPTIIKMDNGQPNPIITERLGLQSNIE